MNTAQQAGTPEYTNRFRPSQAEIDRRYRNVRAAMEQHGLDALVICGNEYTLSLIHISEPTRPY